MKALVVEANTHSPYSLSETLARQHFNIASAASHEDAMQILECFEVDIVILRAKADGLCCLSTLRKTRLEGFDTPVIIVAEPNSRLNAVDAFSAGADDFIQRGVDEDELVARIKAIVRRARGVANSTIQFGKLTIDLNDSCAFADGKPLKLTVKEYELLQALAMRKGRTVTKESLMSLLYNHESEPELKIIDVFICKLRKKLAEALDGENPIDTVWGRGYMMRANNTVDLTEQADEPCLIKSASASSPLLPETAKRRAPVHNGFAHVA